MKPVDEQPTKKKKKKSFKPIASLKIPPEMGKLVSSLKMPFEQVQGMMLEEQRDADEELEARSQFHSMAL